MHPVRSLLGLLLLAGASWSLAQPAAGEAAEDRMMPLATVIPVSGEQARTLSALLCNTARDFCLRAWRATDDAAWTLDVHDRVPTHANLTPVRRITLPASDYPGGEELDIWPHLIREASGAMLIGVESLRRTGFSGGGAGQTDLVLLRIESAAAESVEVLTVQTGYTSMIRACFSEAEYRRWGDFCHDEYEFTGSLGLAPAAGGRPRLTLRTTARSFPRGARAEGSDRAGLRRSDLVWEPDPGCSYLRTFTFNAASGHYEPDRPLPDCSLYALP